jgi:hypothetical protein
VNAHKAVEEHAHRSIGIIGAGAIGSAIAEILARVGIEVTIANSRGPRTLADLETLGPSVGSLLAWGPFRPLLVLGSFVARWGFWGSFVARFWFWGSFAARWGFWGSFVARFWFWGSFVARFWFWGSFAARWGFWGSFVARSVVGSFVARDGLKNGWSRGVPSPVRRGLVCAF